MNKSRKPKILFYDVETSYIIARIWGTGKQFINHSQIVEGQHTKIICIAYKWNNERKVHCLTWNMKTQNCDKVIDDFSKIVEQADVAIAHNGDSFDVRRINTQRLLSGKSPIAWPTTEDTLKQLRQVFYFPSYKLDYISKALLGEGKSPTVFKDWVDIVERKDKKALKKMVKYCVAPHHQVLTKDLRWVPIGEISPGDVILGFEENGIRRRYKNAMVLEHERETQPVMKVILESGKEFIVTPDHKWLIGKQRSVTQNRTTQVGGYVWKTTQELRIGDISPKLLDTWETENSRDSSWLAGIYDGEGSVSTDSRVQITIGQNPDATLDRIEKLVKKYAPGLGSKFTNKKGKCRTVWLRGNLADRLKFLGTVRPERLINKINFDTMGRLEARNGLDYVKSIEYAGEQDIIVMSTSTNTFVCDGYPMHNCKRDVKLLADAYKKVKPFLKPKVNRALITKGTCVSCGSDHVHSKGTTTLSGGRYKRFQCQDCGHYFRDSTNLLTPAQLKKQKNEEKV